MLGDTFVYFVLFMKVFGKLRVAWKSLDLPSAGAGFELQERPLSLGEVRILNRTYGAKGKTHDQNFICKSRLSKRKPDVCDTWIMK